MTSPRSLRVLFAMNLPAFAHAPGASGDVLSNAMLATTAPALTTAWREVAQIGGATEGIAVEGKYAYVGVGLRLVVLDIGDPAHMRQVGATAPFPDFVRAIAVSGSTAYVADGSGGLRVIDIGNPASPREIGSWQVPGFARGVAVAGTTAYVADGPYGLRMIDITNAAHPKETGAAFVTKYAYAVAVSGNFAYVAAGGAGLLIADVANPAHP